MKTVDEIASRWLAGTALGEAETRVLHSTVHRKPLSRDINRTLSDTESYGDRLADSIARLGGSWGFITGFMAFLALWALLNVWFLAGKAFDPYPFVFLNLILSMLAAIQAPVIMMSQNRQASRDRIDATHDYEVNLKAEIEIMALHEKMDALRHQEILAVHEQVAAISAALQRLEARLAAQDPAP